MLAIGTEHSRLATEFQRQFFSFHRIVAQYVPPVLIFQDQTLLNFGSFSVGNVSALIAVTISPWNCRDEMRLCYGARRFNQIIEFLCNVPWPLGAAGSLSCSVTSRVGGFSPLWNFLERFSVKKRKTKVEVAHNCKETSFFCPAQPLISHCFRLLWCTAVTCHVCSRYFPSLRRRASCYKKTMDLVGVEASSWRSERKNILQAGTGCAQANERTNEPKKTNNK